MMEKKRITEEGLLEKYLLGELSKEEAAQLEHVLQNDQELFGQFQQMEADFEKMAFENAIAPPKEVKISLKKSLEKSKVKRLHRTPLLAAASLALLFLVSSFWMYSKWQSAEENLKSLQNQTVDLQNRLENLENNYQLTSTRLESINNVNVVPLVLYGNHKAPNAKAVAYVNHKSKLVIINPKGLPSLPNDRTYQMWSDVDGEMIDMGILSTDKELVTLKYIDNAESLNITIEPAGGNDHPTVEELVSYVTL